MSFSHEYQRRAGEWRACPIELGAMLMLADHECEHGNLPSRRHPDPVCGCFRAPTAKQLRAERALRLANQARLAQARLLRDLRASSSWQAGLRRAAGLLADPPEVLLTVRVSRFLQSVPRVGRQRAAMLMRKAGTGTGVQRIGDLSVRQRAAIVDELLLIADRHEASS